MTTPPEVVKLKVAAGVEAPTVGVGNEEPVMLVEVEIVSNSSFVVEAIVSSVTDGTHVGRAQGRLDMAEEGRVVREVAAADKRLKDLVFGGLRDRAR